MRVRHLLEVLRQLPGDALVTTWDGGVSEDIAVETALVVDGVYERVLVLGMELPAALRRTGDVLWTNAPGEALGPAATDNETGNDTGEEREAS